MNPLSDAALSALAPVLAPSEVVAMVAPAVGCTLVLTDRQLLLVRDGHSFRPRSGIQRWVVDRSLSVRLGPVRQTTGQLAIECRGRTASVFLPTPRSRPSTRWWPRSAAGSIAKD